MTHPTQEDDVKAIRDALALCPLPEDWAVGPDFDNDGTLERIVCALGGSAVVAVTMDFGPNNPHLRAANAAFIAAANPARIARLLARLEQAERQKTPFRVLLAVTAEKNRMGKALELACSYLTDEQVELIKAAMPDDAHIAAIASEAKP